MITTHNEFIDTPMVVGISTLGKREAKQSIGNLKENYEICQKVKKMDIEKTKPKCIFNNSKELYNISDNDLELTINPSEFTEKDLNEDLLINEDLPRKNYSSLNSIDFELKKSIMNSSKDDSDKEFNRVQVKTRYLFITSPINNFVPNLNYKEGTSFSGKCVSDLIDKEHNKDNDIPNNADENRIFVFGLNKKNNYSQINKKELKIRLYDEKVGIVYYKIIVKRV